MGIRYGTQGLIGSRLFDLEIYLGNSKSRIYSILEYQKFTLLIFGDRTFDLDVPEYLNFIQIYPYINQEHYWSNNSPYNNQAILVRPDSYIMSSVTLDNFNLENLIHKIYEDHIFVPVQRRI